MEASIIQFQKEFLTKPPVKRVFIIHGDEPYLIKTFLNKVKEKYGNSYTVLWGDELTEEEFYSNLSESSIFGSTKERVIVIFNFEDFLKKLGRRKKSKEFVIKTLKGVKNNYVFIVFDRKLQKQELSSEPIKSITAFGGVITASKLSKQKIKQLVLKKFKEKGIKVDEEAVDYLLELSEYNLMELKLEVEKLIDYALETKELSLEEVRRLSFFLSGNANVFEFIDAFLKGESEKALILLERLYMWGVHPLQIQKLLSSYVIKLFTLKRLLESGEDEKKAMESLGIKNNFLKLKFSEYLKANELSNLKRILSALRRLDMFQKLYFQPPEETFKAFVEGFLLSGKRAGNSPQ